MINSTQSRRRTEWFTHSHQYTETETRLAPATKATLRERFASSVADPVLRMLLAAMLIARFGRGVYYTMSALYFTFVVSLTAGEVAAILGVAGGTAVATSYLGGRLSDRVSARKLVMVFMAGEAIALMCFPLVTSFTTAVIVACAASGLTSAGHAARMSIVARAFSPTERVNARAVLRTGTNIAVALGTVAAGVALLIDTTDSYHAIMLIAGVAALAGVVPLFRLPARVDAKSTPVESGSSSSPDAARAADDPSDSGSDVSSGSSPGKSPLRDRRYVALTILAGIFGMQFGVAETGVPLWVTLDTDVPKAVVSLLLVLKTGVVIFLQVPLSRGTGNIRVAGRVSVLAGGCMVAACVLYAIAADVPVAFAIAALVVGALVHAFAEVWSQAGMWELSFALADQRRAGAYQGVFAMGFGLGAMVAPPLVAVTALQYGFAGWLVLAAIFMLAALGIGMIARASAPAQSFERLSPQR